MEKLFEVSVERSGNKKAGIWKIIKNGENVSEFIPVELRNSPMDTVCRLEDGGLWCMDIDMWAQLHENWLKHICSGKKEIAMLYEEISRVDWHY